MSQYSGLQYSSQPRAGEPWAGQLLALFLCVFLSLSFLEALVLLPL